MFCIDNKIKKSLFVAPSLRVTVRFVGEEPGDTVTRQYNENMRKILPQYNIEFCEIPRKETGGEVISAKRVRAALKVGDFDTIKKLVPQTTFDFLVEQFGDRKKSPKVDVTPFITFTAGKISWEMENYFGI